jgi:polynucleotide 5'-hydroxyl-kinase GRC3/NOL9
MTTEKLAKNDFFLLVGPGKVTVSQGAVEVIGALIPSGKTLEVPLGKRVPIRAMADSVLEVAAGAEALTKMEASSIPEEWDGLAERVAREKQAGKLYSIIVLGEVDTGKTFFSTYLANKILQSGGKTAILDCDTGQSDIGPSGTFGMLVMKEPVVFLSEEKPTHLYFLGSHSPGLHFLPTMTGLDNMMKKARQDADVLIIDTTGWVQGDGGRALKKAKLDMVGPQMVILMQRGTELEHLVRHLPKESVVRLPVSRKASSTSQMERKSLRERVNIAYFKDSRLLEIPFNQVYSDRSYFLTGTKIDLEGTFHAERLSAWEGTLVITSGPLIPEITKSWPKDLGRIMNFVAGEEKGLGVALLDAQQNVLAMGRLDEIDFLNNRFRVRAPFDGSNDQIKGIQFGSLKLTEKGEEAGFLEPGSF